MTPEHILTGPDAETLFCIALLRVLDVRQIANVLHVYGELKSDAPRHLTEVRAMAARESEATQ